MPTMICLMDILIRFNTAYYEEGEMVKSRKKIILNYLFNNFLIDFMTSFVLLFHSIFPKEL